MGSVLLENPTKMNPKIVIAFVFLAFVAVANSGRIFVLDDGEDEDVLYRVRRDTPEARSNQAPSYAPVPDEFRVRRDNSPYTAPAPSYAPSHAPKGRVGPVYTFVKTDPQANFKWGVRH